MVNVSDFPQVLQRFTNPKQTISGQGVLHTSCQGPKELHFGQLTSFHSLASGRHLQDQPIKLSAYHFVSPTRWLQAKHRYWLTLEFTRAHLKQSHLKHQVTSFRPHQNTTQLPPQITHTKGELGRQQSFMKMNPTSWGQPPTTAHRLQSWPFFTDSQPEAHSLKLTL